jgi:hypothetical protein
MCSIGSATNINPGLSSLRPALAYNGTGYGVAYHDYRVVPGHVYFARLDSAGKPVPSSEVDLGVGAYPDIAWDAAYSRYGVVWTTGGTLSLAILESNGTVVLTQQVAAAANNSIGSPRVADKNGGAFGIVWNDSSLGTHRVFLAQYNPNSCAKIGNTVTVSSGYGIEPDIAYGPSGPTPSVAWGVVWKTSPDAIVLARLDSSGAQAGSTTALTTDTNGGQTPRVAWNSNKYEFGVIWNDTGCPGPCIRFARVKNTGVQVGSTLSLVSYPSGGTYRPSIARLDDTYGVAWDVGTAGFVRIDYAGAQMSPILSAPSGSWGPDVAAAGSLFTLAWTNGDPYTAQVTCP